MSLKDDRVEQCLRSCGSEFQMWGPKQEKARKPRLLRLYCWIFSICGCQKKSVVYETECRHVAVQKVSRTRTIYSTETHTTCRPDITYWLTGPTKTRYLLTRKRCAIVYTVITEYIVRHTSVSVNECVSICTCVCFCVCEIQNR